MLMLATTLGLDRFRRRYFQAVRDDDQPRVKRPKGWIPWLFWGAAGRQLSPLRLWMPIFSNCAKLPTTGTGEKPPRSTRL